MRFCKYCGCQVPDEAKQCPQCYKHIGTKNETADTRSQQNISMPQKSFSVLKNTHITALVLMILTGVIVVCIYNSGRCAVGGCNNKAVPGKSYCYNHKCIISNCDRERYPYSKYCYTHLLLYSDEATPAYSPKVYSSELKISNVKLSSNSSYTTAEGTITNNSDQTVSYVKIKGSFKNNSGTVVDTDWTYAVGSEGLAPGESCTWSMSIKKDSSVKECTVSILDFDY